MKKEPDSDEWKQANELNIKTLQVKPKSVCESFFSKTELKKKGISFFQARRQLPRGFTSDIACLGNDFSSDIACEGDIGTQYQFGSPIIKRISGTSSGRPYFEQHYIMASGIDCNLPSFGVRVTNPEIFTWIQEQLS